MAITAMLNFDGSSRLCLKLFISKNKIWLKYQIKSNLFAISAVHNTTIHEFALRLAGQTGDNFALMSAHKYF